MEIINNLSEVISAIFATVGVVITIFGLPGTWLVFIGILMWSWANAFTIVTWPWLLLFLVVTILSTFLDNVGIVLGAKKYGASVWGMVGSIVGLILGAIIGNIPGLILGAFLGAVAAEMLFAQKNSDDAMKAGFGTLIGFVLGNLLKLIVALLMVLGWWLIAR